MFWGKWRVDSDWAQKLLWKWHISSHEHIGARFWLQIGLFQNTFLEIFWTSLNLHIKSYETKLLFLTFLFELTSYNFYIAFNF